jgi:hypothetical protein
VVNSVLRSGDFSSVGLRVFSSQDFSAAEGWRGEAGGSDGTSVVFDLSAMARSSELTTAK